MNLNLVAAGQIFCAADRRFEMNFCRGRLIRWNAVAEFYDNRRIFERVIISADPLHFQRFARAQRKDLEEGEGPAATGIK